MNENIRADALVESGASLREIARCFATPVDAYRYYADTMHHRFTPSQAALACECVSCKGGSGLQAHQITWRAVAHDKSTGIAALFHLFLGQLTSGRVEVQFTTAHRYCAACAWRVLWSFSSIQVARTVLFVVLLVALFVIVPLVVLTIAVVFSAPDLLPRLSLVTAAGLAVLFLVYLGHRWLWTSAIPLHLRFIARFPFEPRDIRKMDENLVPLTPNDPKIENGNRR